MISLMVVCCLWGLVSSSPGRLYDIQQAPNLFEDFMTTYNKQYSSEKEKKIRFDNFRKNLVEINEKNLQDPVYGINEFSDLTHQEFRSTYTCVMEPTGYSQCNRVSVASLNLTVASGNFDWRTRGVVSRVTSQGQCGSCWAFSTIGNIESQYAIRHGQVVELSKSQLVDCDKNNYGCRGGFMDRAMSYISSAGGVMAEADYPYVAREQRCKFDRSRARVRVNGCQRYTGIDEQRLKDTLQSVGPLAISLYSARMQGYVGGIMRNCPQQQADHAVLLVGFGEENGVPYWLIKNSWGTSWGEQGYIRVQRGVNACNIVSPTGLIVSATV